MSSTAKQKNEPDADADSESNIQSKFIVNPTDVESTASQSKPQPSTSSPLSRDELIKSFVIQLSSDSSEDDTPATRLSQIEGCRGYLNVCMDGGNKDDKFSAMRRLRSDESRKPQKYEKSGLRGLLNIGNTCFMNSILQCLSNTAPLLRYILADKFLQEMNKASPMKGNLLYSFVKLIKEVWTVKAQSPVDTTNLKAQLQLFAPRFKGFAQQDAQELLRFLLEGLHYELNRIQTKPPYLPFVVDPGWNSAAHSLFAWKHYIRVDNSKIVDVFVGQLKSTLRCLTCGTVSVTFDPFWDLSISIPQPRPGTFECTLEQCLDSFTREETLDNHEKPNCVKCKSAQKSTKHLAIERFPEVLAIHLKRFKDESKLRTKVRFPLLGLDIGPYSSSKTNCCSYNLYGISNHSGNTLSGHYVAYCRHPYSNSWFCYDDQAVYTTTSQSVKEAEAYVLFYEMSEGSKSVLF